MLIPLIFGKAYGVLSPAILEMKAENGGEKQMVWIEYVNYTRAVSA